MTTKLEELARSLGEEFYLWATVEHPELVAQPHYYAGRIQAELEPVLKPLLDAGQELLTIAELTRDELGPSATWRIADATGKFGEQLSQWRKK